MSEEKKPSWRETGVEVVPVKKWGGFQDTVLEYIGEKNTERWIFRGVSDSGYKLQSSFERKFGNERTIAQKMIMERLISNFKILLEKNGLYGSDNEKTLRAKGQHYGLATSMLDWSTSRYIAAFFAFAPLSKDKEYPTYLDFEKNRNSRSVSVFALDRGSEFWLSETTDLEQIEIVAPFYTKDNERIRRQGGYFTVNHTTHDSIESFVKCTAHKYLEINNPPIIRFDINVDQVRVALRDLHEMKISYSELFPGIEGVANEVMLKEWLY